MNWTLMKSQTSCIQAAEMRFLSHIAGYTFQDRRRNADIWQKLNIMRILNRIAQLKWLKHLNQMKHCLILKQVLNYKLKGRRSVGLSLIHI